MSLSVSEHVWIGGEGGEGAGVGGDWGELPAGGIRASQGTFSSFISHCHLPLLLTRDNQRN